MRARSFVRRCGIDAAPVDIDKYLVGANASLRASTNLLPGEAGNTMFVSGQHLITVNGKDTSERQRFTTLHELGHIVLELPSRHADGITADALYGYVRRPPEEVLCDIFAAECLLPHELLRPDMNGAAAGFEFVQEIAGKYGASLACTASRVTVNAPFACAYALSQEGYVRFATYSTSMRESKFWITPGISVPTASITGQCIKAGSTAAAGIVPGYLWTSADGYSDIDLSEETRLLCAWNQALTLIYLDAGDAPDPRRSGHLDANDKEPLLKELDGVLPWPSGKRRK